MAVPLSDYAVHLRPTDNVAVARKPIPQGTTFQFDGGTFTLPKGATALSVRGSARVPASTWHVGQETFSDDAIHPIAP